MGDPSHSGGGDLVGGRRDHIYTYIDIYRSEIEGATLANQNQMQFTNIPWVIYHAVPPDGTQLFINPLDKFDVSTVQPS